MQQPQDDDVVALNKVQNVMRLVRQETNSPPLALTLRNHSGMGGQGVEGADNALHITPRLLHSKGKRPCYRDV